jgi:heme oxygenase (biliverdin-producing, ferredoxin)
MPMTTETGLATQMREGSRLEHQQAESSAFMAALAKAEVNTAGYAAYLSQLLPVYRCLERVAVQLADDPIAGPIIDPALFRSSALANDLDFWAAAHAKESDSPAVQAYCARIEGTLTDPPRYLAHHYTRYLGDLSGGQVIKAVLVRAFGLGPGRGVEFYEFAAVPKPKLYKDDYRDRLNALPLDAAQRDQVVAEVRAVFGLNAALFAELSVDLPRYLR